MSGNCIQNIICAINYNKDQQKRNQRQLTGQTTQEAMQSFDDKKTKVIVLAWQELINKNKVAELKLYKGKVNLDIDIDTLRKRNVHFD